MDTPPSALCNTEAMQTCNWHSKMAAKVRDGRKAKLAEGLKRQGLVAFKQQPAVNEAMSKDWFARPGYYNLSAHYNR